MFIIRKDLWDQGITNLEKFAEWKRPDGRKPIVNSYDPSSYELWTLENYAPVTPKR